MATAETQLEVIRNQERAPIMTAGRGLELRTLDDMFRVATAICKSGFAPKGVDTPEAAFVAMQMGFEIGLSPMAAIQNVAVINGRPSVWGDAVKGIVLATNACEDFREWFDGDGEKLTAWCSIKRRGYSEVTRSFSMADAKTADLSKKPGPWQQYPKRMLQMRARSWACRDAFPDALKGLFVAEEARDIPAETIDVTPPRREVASIDVNALTSGTPPAPENSKAEASDSPQPKTTKPKPFDRDACLAEIAEHAQRVGIDRLDDAVVKLGAETAQESQDVGAWTDTGLKLLLAAMKAQK